MRFICEAGWDRIARVVLGAWWALGLVEAD